MDEDYKGARDYKVSRGASDELSSEIEVARQTVASEIEKNKTGILIGGFLADLKRERKETNAILRSILKKIDAMEARVVSLEKGVVPPGGPKPPIVLPDVDVDVYEFVKKNGRVCAEHVQKRFRYKGVNAACARLSGLAKAGVLGKTQVGRKVYYLPKKEVHVTRA